MQEALGDKDFAETDIRSRVHTGTVNFATVPTVPTAVALHQQIQGNRIWDRFPCGHPSRRPPLAGPQDEDRVRGRGFDAHRCSLASS
ncbi:hypothetical protein JJC00_35380 [Bradyrhizobium diazoefficiens]|uniref:hypothetical protein n=1 Tax=Bradyrhizobium diazoefficiens TaxID=1355477 RepID=UPI00190A61D3|nr:hypothetical protein [Bradyrhizobium diazoefficiens]QQO37934.1 hypothetical protein JJC00_35380 [Bradyrhizobium diazoefficiens]